MQEINGKVIDFQAKKAEEEQEMADFLEATKEIGLGAMLELFTAFTSGDPRLMEQAKERAAAAYLERQKKDEV